METNTVILKKYALVTTYFCFGCEEPSRIDLQKRFSADCDIEDIYINFSNSFDPWHMDHLNVGVAGGRKDLIYGKIFLLKQFIEKHILNKYEYLCHIDYSDTRFCRSFIQMMDEFAASNQDFIISTEKQAWPPIQSIHSWGNNQIKEEEFYFINSGALIAKVGTFYKYICKMHDICLTTSLNYYDDQGVWQYYNLYVDKLDADETCKYFFSTAHLDESYYTIENNTVRTKFNTLPYLIHDNSSFSLGLTQRNLFINTEDVK
jgi:hypothetical protein